MQVFNNVSGYITFPNKTLDFPMSKYPEWKDLLRESWIVQESSNLTRYMVVETIQVIVYGG
jgi:hypothetical protein